MLDDKQKTEFFRTCAIAALPKVMEQYNRLECPMINYEMDDEHIERIARGAWRMAKEMISRIDVEAFE